MPEPITTVGLGAIAAYLGKDGIAKLLGPTADYLGGGLKELAQKRVENIGHIFKNAESKLGKKMGEPGQVPPKVLKAVLDEGSFSQDELAVEYFGGILASSRTEAGRDDRGARIAKLLERLSTYQLRSHYLIYSSIRHVFAGSGLSMQMNDRVKMRIYIPMNPYGAAMEFSTSEIGQIGTLLPHIFFGLHAENLIEQHFTFGPKEAMVREFPAATDAGILCQPTAVGTELFLWAFGESDKPLDYIFHSDFDCDVDNMPKFVAGASPLKPWGSGAA